MKLAITLAGGFLAALLGAGASAQGGAPGVTASTITIGQSAPLSGSNEELGQDIRNGALAYFKKVNDAGGVHGRKIELDDPGRRATRCRAPRPTPRSWWRRRACSRCSATRARRCRVPRCRSWRSTRCLSSRPFTGADPMRVFNKYVYNMRASYADELEKIVDHFAPLGVKRFSIVYYDDVVGRENLTAVDRALKKRSLETVSKAVLKDRVKPDIEAGVKDVAKGNPDVVILTTLYKTTADFIKLAKQSGVGAQMASNSFPGASPLAKELGKDGPGVIIATVVPPFSKRALPIVAEYRAAIEK